MSDITLGLEEELQVIDCATLRPSAHNFSASKSAFKFDGGDIDREIVSSIIEIKTTPSISSTEIVQKLQGLRHEASRVAGLQGQSVVACSLHPEMRWNAENTPGIDDPKEYHFKLAAEYQDLVRQVTCSGVHVHLGADTPQKRVAVFNGLRDHLPALLSLSAGSPFHESRDTGLSSWRHSIFDRLPRTGTFEPLKDEHEYWRVVERLRATGCIGEKLNLWGDVRLHHVYPTVEVRIMDVMPDLNRTWLAVTLLHLQAMKAVDDSERGVFAFNAPTLLVNENRWRARRYGIESALIDWQTDAELPLRTYLEKWAQTLRPYAEQTQQWNQLKDEVRRACEDLDNAQWQRAWHGAGGFTNVLEQLREKTLRSAA